MIIKSFLRDNWENLMPLVFFMLVIFLHFVIGTDSIHARPGRVEGFAIFFVMVINIFWALRLAIVFIRNLIRKSWLAALMNFIGVGLSLLLAGGVFATILYPYG